MDSRNKKDLISTLPDVVLLIILSYLSFKDNIKTSVLSKRWRNLCYETKDIAFKDSEYVDHTVSDNHSKSVSFVRYMCQWVSRVPCQVIESFEICLSVPVGFKQEMESLIEFALSRKVKKLLLDFSDPFWTNTWDAVRYEVVVELPELIYSLETLESLKIYACWFNPSRFNNLGSLRRLSIGYLGLVEIESLLRQCFSLESLTINSCWGFNSMMLTGGLKELVFENCYFLLSSCSFNLPNLDIFKYSGIVLCMIRFEKVNTIMNEVFLDFGVEHYDDGPAYSYKQAGEIISHLLNDLRCARTLTVCSYLLQAIQHCEDPVYMLRDMETQHLILKTNLHEKEFMAMKLLLDHCPNLETVTIIILSQNPSNINASNDDIDPESKWLKNMSARCLKRTLKVVEVRNFCNGRNEFYMLHYLVRPKNGHVLERVNLYMPKWLEGSQRMWAELGAAFLQSVSDRVEIILHNT